MKTLIAIPCMNMVHTTFMCCFKDLDFPKETAYMVTRNTLIYTARNRIALNAIKMGFDRVLWLDSDTIFESDTLFRLSEDMNSGLDYVSGLYFMRQVPTSPVVYSDVWWNVQPDGNVQTGNTAFFDYPKDTLFEIAGSGFGCVMTSVELLKDVCEKYGNPFTPLMGMSEDMAFCWRVKQIGRKMFCDSRVKVGHSGEIVFDEDMYIKERLHSNAP